MSPDCANHVQHTVRTTIDEFSATVNEEGEVQVSRDTQIKDEVLGYMLVYVDGAMVIGPTTLIEKVFEIYQTTWDVKGDWHPSCG